MQDFYTFLTDRIKTEFLPDKMLKETDRSSIRLIRHRTSKKPYVFRQFEGNIDVYRKLLTVDCPYLPRIYEAAQKDGKAAVLEEYVEGNSLQELLETACLTQEQTRSVATDLCKALAVLHGCGAVHRDVKPSNVILRGKDAVLIDFDASRVFKKENCQDTVVLGTTGYAAPEQYGMSQTDARSDIYSLGVLMNVMLTGSHPSRMLAPGRYGRIIRKCTTIDPAGRYRSAVALLEDL